jgi:hypothetical protein
MGHLTCKSIQDQLIFAQQQRVRIPQPSSVVLNRNPKVHLFRWYSIYCEFLCMNVDFYMYYGLLLIYLGKSVRLVSKEFGCEQTGNCISPQMIPIPSQLNPPKISTSMSSDGFVKVDGLSDPTDFATISKQAIQVGEDYRIQPITVPVITEFPSFTLCSDYDTCPHIDETS